MKNIKGSLILALTAFIWGTAFVAQTSGAENVGTFTFNAARSYVGAAFLGIVIWVLSIAKKNRSTQGNDINESAEGGIANNTEKSAEVGITENINQTEKWPLLGGILCGIVLFAAMGFQQAGIGLYPEGVAASGRSGFLTATYVVMVAICSQFRGKKLNSYVTVSVIGTIAGMYLLCMAGGFSNIYIGDVLGLVCAMCFTVHIFVIDRFSKVDSIKLSCIQFLTAAVLSTIMTLIFETVNVENLRSAMLPILYAGVMSSGVAYTLQMVGQKYAEPAVASIVMSLESVFAVIAGGVILHEVLSGRELAGCTLVFISVILAQIPQFKKEKEE